MKFRNSCFSKALNGTKPLGIVEVGAQRRKQNGGKKSWGPNKQFTPGAEKKKPNPPSRKQTQKDNEKIPWD